MDLKSLIEEFERQNKSSSDLIVDSSTLKQFRMRITELASDSRIRRVSVD